MDNVDHQNRVCINGGYLAGPKARIPEDPSYFQTGGAKFYVGCSRLRCKLCGQMARQQSGLRDGNGASEHPTEIYNDPDLAKSPYLAADPDSRVYACACSVVTLTGGRTVPFPNGVWVCAGHPAPDGAAVLPQISLSAARDFALSAANNHLQQNINLLAITFTSGEGLVGTLANVSLGGDWPALKVWTNETTMTPLALDFANIAGACIQLTDGTLLPY